MPIQKIRLKNKFQDPVNCCLNDELLAKSPIDPAWVNICKEITEKNTCNTKKNSATNDDMCKWHDTSMICPPTPAPGAPTPSTCISETTVSCGYNDEQLGCCPDGYDDDVGVMCKDCGYCDTSLSYQGKYYCKWRVD